MLFNIDVPRKLLLSRGIALLLLWAAIAVGQMVPGRYVVELSTEPLAQWARVKGRSAAASSRLAGIEAEQGRVRRLIEQRRGRVLSTVNALMNALVVDIAEGESAALSSLPGVIKVYPVEMVHADLDHALPLHYVPNAWGDMGGMEKAGAGVKIAILDTGITPDHPAFNDPSMQAPSGYPIADKPANLALTNGKIIVARSYERFFPNASELDTARDRFGHGTAVAMCAAGAPNQGPLGRITGVAPKAWIGVYKIAPLNTGGSTGDVIMKALDDAIADGMEVVNLSFGSAFVPQLDKSAVAVSLERAVRLGVMVVVAAGNSGPGLATMDNFASIPSVISVGASDTDRVFQSAVAIPDTKPFMAFRSTGPAPGVPISAPLKAIAANPCNPLPDDSLTGAIALAQIGGCTFEMQLNNAGKAGAVAMIFSTPSPLSSPGRFNPLTAKLPGVMIGFQDGATIRAALVAESNLTGTVDFGDVPFSNDAARLLGFSSRGPTYSYLIKPDLTATGYVYSATERIDERGGVYNKTGYVIVSGTSLSSPIVAGAAAALKSARPGLTTDQYRSLLINTATPLMQKNGVIERVQQTGAGVLNLDASLYGTVAAYPTSLSFGTGPGTLDDFRELTLTNLGKTADTLVIGTSRYDGAPALRFSENPLPDGAGENLTLRIAPGQSRTLYAFWRFNGLDAGERQGQITISATQNGNVMLVPYWYATPSNVPASLRLLSGLPSQLTMGQQVSVYFKISDSVGIAILDRQALQFSSTVVAGGGSIGTLTDSTTYPGLVFATIKMGPDPARNTFRFSFATFPPITFNVDGTQ